MPVLAKPRWDHTYVISSCGLRWGCNGGWTGGQKVCSGTGSSIIADCLSQPQSLAGINCGVTGVCHQMSNRILHPTGGLTVAGCRGYQLSHFAYGVYGRGSWTSRQACYAAGTALAGTGGGSEGVSMTSKLAYDRAVADAHARGTSEDAVRFAELEALTRSELAEPLDHETLTALFGIQTMLHDSQQALADALESGELHREAYLAQVYALLRSSLDRCQALIGPERTFALFGEAVEDPEGLIDRASFLEGPAAH